MAAALVAALLAATVCADTPPRTAADGVSPALKLAADAIDGEIAVTCLVDRADHPDLTPVRDLLDRLAAGSKDKVSVAIADGAEKRRQVVSSLRKRLLAGAAAHVTVAKDFRALAEARIAECNKDAAAWSGLPADAWLNRVGLTPAVAEAMAADRDRYREAMLDCPVEEGPDLPDYAAMARRIDVVLRNDAETLRQIDGALRGASAVIDSLGQQREALAAKAAGVCKALADTVAGAGKADAPLPEDLTKALTDFAAGLRGAAGTANEAAKALTDFNDATRGLAQAGPMWRHGQTPLPDAYQAMVERVCNLADQAEQVAATGNPETRKNVVIRARQLSPRLLDQAEALAAGTDAMAKAMADVDKASAELVAAAKDRKILAPIARIAPVLAACRTLPDLPDAQRLAERLRGDNVLVVQATRGAQAIGFDEMYLPAADGGRVFDGESALAGALLAASGKPVGQVVLVCFEVLPAAGQGARAPIIGPIYSGQLTDMRSALERAGLKVALWNMARQVESPAAPAGVRQTLLVLPPPPPAPPEFAQDCPGWTNLHTDSLAAAVRRCGSAVFLTGYAYGPPNGKSPEYPLADYLRRQWGLNPRTDLRLVRGRPSDDADGTFRVGVAEWNFMPLTGFADHPSARTLKGRRAVWMDACPILPTSEPVEGVTVESILAVPAGESACWATVDAAGVVDRLRRGLGEASAVVGEGDLKPPFAVAAAARRGAGKETVRIVVMGVGPSLTDPFLRYPVPRVEPAGAVRDGPPPSAATTLLVNCIYHVLDKDDLIGPAPRKIHDTPPADPKSD